MWKNNHPSGRKICKGGLEKENLSRCQNHATAFCEGDRGNLLAEKLAVEFVSERREPVPKACCCICKRGTEGMETTNNLLVEKLAATFASEKREPGIPMP